MKLNYYKDNFNLNKYYFKKNFYLIITYFLINFLYYNKNINIINYFNNI